MILRRRDVGVVKDSQFCLKNYIQIMEVCICNILLAHTLGFDKTKRTLELIFGEKSTTSGTVMFKLLACALKKVS